MRTRVLTYQTLYETGLSVFLGIIMLIPGRLESQLVPLLGTDLAALRFAAPLGFLGFLGLMVPIVRGRVSVKLNQLLLLLLPGLWIVPLVIATLLNSSSVAGVNVPNEEVLRGLYLYAVPFYLAVAIMITKPVRMNLRMIENAFLFYAAVIGVLALLSAFGRTSVLGVNMAELAGYEANLYRFRTPMGGPITSSFVFQMAALVCGYRWLKFIDHGRNRSEATLLFVIFVFFATLTFLSLSRGNVLSLLFGFFVLVRVAKVSRFAVIRSLLGIVLAGMTVFLAGWAFVQMETAAPIERLWSLSDTSVSLRAGSMLFALERVADSPLVGAGIGRLWMRAGENVVRQIGGYVVAREPHSAYLLLASEGGVFAVAGFLIAMTLLYRSIPKSRPHYLAIMWSVGVLSLVSSDVFVTPRVSVIFFALVGLATQGRVSEEVIVCDNVAQSFSSRVR